MVRVKVLTLRKSRGIFFFFFFPPRNLEDVPLKPGRDVAETEIESVLACAILRHTFVHCFPLFKRLYSKKKRKRVLNSRIKPLPIKA